MDAATQGILAAIFSPAAIGALVWWLLRDHADKVKDLAKAAQEQAIVIEGLKTRMENLVKSEADLNQMREKIGETTGLRKEVRELTERVIKVNAATDAAWRTLETLRK